MLRFARKIIIPEPGMPEIAIKRRSEVGVFCNFPSKDENHQVLRSLRKSSSLCSPQVCVTKPDSCSSISVALSVNKHKMAVPVSTCEVSGGVDEGADTEGLSGVCSGLPCLPYREVCRLRNRNFLTTFYV